MHDKYMCIQLAIHGAKLTYVTLYPTDIKNKFPNDLKWGNTERHFNTVCAGVANSLGECQTVCS